jgi:hypothetical protein
MGGGPTIQPGVEPGLHPNRGWVLPLHYWAREVTLGVPSPSPHLTPPTRLPLPQWRVNMVFISPFHQCPCTQVLVSSVPQMDHKYSRNRSMKINCSPWRLLLIELATPALVSLLPVNTRPHGETAVLTETRGGSHSRPGLWDWLQMLSFRNSLTNGFIDVINKLFTPESDKAWYFEDIEEVKLSKPKR